MALGIPALAGAARILGASVLAAGHDAQILAAEAAGGGGAAPGAALGSRAAGLEGSDGFGVLADGLRTGGAVLALVLLLAGALADVRDREAGTLAMLHLAAPRWRSLGAKAVVLAAAALVGLLLLAITCALAAALTPGLGPVVEDGYTMATSGELAREVLRALAASILPLVAASMFGLLASTLASSSGGAAGATLVPFVLLTLTGGILGAAGRHLFVTHVPFLGDGSALARLPGIARAYSDAAWEEGGLAWGSGISGIQACVMFALAALVARRRAVP